MSTTGYTCYCCGKDSSDIPLFYGSDAPIYADALTPEEYEQRVQFNNDVWVLDKSVFFVRGIIQIPIIGTDKIFGWGVWSSLSDKSFETLMDTWDKPGRENFVAPMFGWLSTRIPFYPDTLNLEMMTHLREVGTIPVFEVEHSAHPLGQEQRHGITMERVHEIAKTILG